ncbi:IclR family transcriptional regulator [Herbaspirillum robiniae]|uniref:IclR family transcriptional regulator n=1 Tax=Herbaspirillum robiniae TaxID=2014887 RepID=A0A246WQN8_9BURK|nr:IclR family transcriptional regulator [Herbaspirillum robiniae]NUU04311.1 IclR family transcriptional regulator [Herbaspirillum robiniae]OWY27916.1 IclR family transcriptional regulator [Herbaspirillum robiniae]
MKAAVRKPARRQREARKDVRIVLRAPNPPEYRNGGAAARSDAATQVTIKPIERGFAVLDAFLGEAEWLANQDIALRTGLPKATVSRLAQTLTALGYLTYSEQRRKYRLAVAVLSLGFAAMVDTDVVLQARPLMQKLADDNGVFVALAGRDGLDMIFFENCHSASNSATVGLGVGEHMPMASSPVGWALLACLHENERNYLLDHMRPYHKRDDWMSVRQKLTDAETQIAEKAYCVSSGDWGPDITVVATPLQLADRLPMVLLCAGQSRTLTKARVEQRAGPQLLAMGRQLQKMEAQRAAL